MPGLRSTLSRLRRHRPGGFKKYWSGRSQTPQRQPWHRHTTRLPSDPQHPFPQPAPFGWRPVVAVERPAGACDPHDVTVDGHACKSRPPARPRLRFCRTSAKGNAVIAPSEPSPTEPQQSNAAGKDAPSEPESVPIPPPDSPPRGSSRVCRPVIARYDPTSYDPSPLSLARLTAELAALDLGLPGEPTANDPLCLCVCGGTITAAGMAMLCA